MRRNQVQIAVDALKTQLERYRKERQKAFNAASEALASQKFFDGEIDRLEKQIQSLEGTNGQ